MLKFLYHINWAILFQVFYIFKDFKIFCERKFTDIYKFITFNESYKFA